MGFYIQGPSQNKASYLIREFEAVALTKQPEDMSFLYADEALVCVVENGPFDAAGYCFNDREFEAFNSPGDNRRKTWLIMKKDVVEKLTGYNPG